MNNEELCPLGQRIKMMLDKNGMTARDLASRAYITDVALSRYMYGKRVPRTPYLYNMAAVLDVTTDWLLYGDAE